MKDAMNTPLEERSNSLTIDADSRPIVEPEGAVNPFPGVERELANIHFVRCEREM